MLANPMPPMPSSNDSSPRINFSESDSRPPLRQMQEKRSPSELSGRKVEEMTSSKKMKTSEEKNRNNKLEALFQFLKELNEKSNKEELRTLILQCEQSHDPLETLSNTQELNLSSCELESLPNQINELHALTKLNLVNNQLCTLPLDLSLPNLRVVRLEKNRFKEIPPAISSIAQERIKNGKHFELYMGQNPIRKEMLPRDLHSVILSPSLF